MIKFESNWSYELFVKRPQLFLPILKKESRYAGREVSGLCTIFKDLKLGDNDKILDLSCGIGRHAILLAQRGYEVIGYDPSEYYIKIARKNANLKASKKKLKLSYYVGNPGYPARNLLRNNEKNFDAIICMFQSFGYISKEFDLKMLRNLRKVSSERCFLVLQTENKLWRLKNIEKYKKYDFGRTRISETWEFDMTKNIFKNHTRFYKKRKEDVKWTLVFELPTYMILYSLKELNDIAKKAGWKYFRNYANISSLNAANIHSKAPVSVYLST